MNFINLISCARNHEKPLIIALQGLLPQDENRTVTYFNVYLKSYGFKVLNIKTENYYKSIDMNAEESKDYDFNNPAAINWDFLRDTLQGIKNENVWVTQCIFDISNHKCLRLSHKNNFPDVIILNGIYALNLFNDKVFNVSKFDCMKPQTQEIDVEYIDNPDNFHKDFKIIKILFRTKTTDSLNTMSSPNLEGNQNLENYCQGSFCSEHTKASLSKNLMWNNYVTQADFIFDKYQANYDSFTKISKKVLSALSSIRPLI